MMMVAELGTLFKSLGDPMRLRLLHVLCAEELTVGELVRILGLPQSSISRHLKALRDQGLVADRPSGPATYYRAQIEGEFGNGETMVRDALAEMMKRSSLPPGDKARLERVLALRQREQEGFFDRIGLRWDALREECFGETFHLEALLHLLPEQLVAADLGTGTGYLLPVLGSHFQRVIGIDSSPPMLDLARRRVSEAGMTNVELRQGEVENLPLKNGEADLAIALLILHHIADIPKGLAEIGRVLRPGGRVLIAEIHPYENEDFRVQMADRRAGIGIGELEHYLEQAGFGHVRSWEMHREPRPEHPLAPLPELYCMTGEKSGGKNRRGTDKGR